MTRLKYQLVIGIDSGTKDHLETEIHNVIGLEHQLVIGLTAGS